MFTWSKFIVVNEHIIWGVLLVEDHVLCDPPALWTHKSCRPKSAFGPVFSFFTQLVLSLFLLICFCTIYSVSPFLIGGRHFVLLPLDLVRSCTSLFQAGWRCCKHLTGRFWGLNNMLIYSLSLCVQFYCALHYSGLRCCLSFPVWFSHLSSFLCEDRIKMISPVWEADFILPMDSLFLFRIFTGPEPLPELVLAGASSPPT